MSVRLMALTIKLPTVNSCQVWVYQNARALTRDHSAVLQGVDVAEDWNDGVGHRPRDDADAIDRRHRQRHVDDGKEGNNADENDAE